MILVCALLYVLTLSNCLLENCVWTESKSEGHEPRHFASAIVRGSTMYIFAGKNIHQYCFNTLESKSLGKLFIIIVHNQMIPIFLLDVHETNRPDKYMEQMASLINNQDFSDCSIVFPKEKKVIYVHKAILAIRCERFDVMFKYDIV